MKLPFPVSGATRELADDYHYKGFPTTILLNGERKIARTFFGYHEMEQLRPASHPCLASRNDRAIYLTQPCTSLVEFVVRTDEIVGGD